jgi:hypothetical protein
MRRAVARAARFEAVKLAPEDLFGKIGDAVTNRGVGRMFLTTPG